MWTTRSEKIHIIIFLFFVLVFEVYYLHSSSRPQQNHLKSHQKNRFVNFTQTHGTKSKTSKETSVLMNDSAIQKNWGLMGTNGKSDIRALRAWEISKGSRDIVVAVIDTGIDLSHEDLRSNLWRNKGEIGLDEKGRSKETNKIDDDGNGFIDDVHGWNFVSNNNKVKDHHGHGTHVAGIIGAEGGNGRGISGVSPKVNLMILKYYDPRFSNTDNLKNTIKAIKYATKMGAKIINYSGGGTQYSQPEFNAIKQAKNKGILFVAAAGNESSNSNKYNYYPANYSSKLNNIISVTAINRSTKVLSSSNWGDLTVHIAAPGENIFSTLPRNKYGHMTGTSQATAFVSGVASLIYAQNREFDYLAVKNQILSTADEKKSLKSKTMTSGKLNAWAALAMQSSIPVTGVKDDLGTHTLPQFEQQVAHHGLSRLKNNMKDILKRAGEK